MCKVKFEHLSFNGYTDGNVERFTGIPYAKAERFLKPVPYEYQVNIIDATKKAPAAPQNPVPFLNDMLGSAPIDDMAQSEDCQYLSITRPTSLSGNAKIPVMVWIHGGSFVTGAGDASIFDPKIFVEEQEVIVVNLTYRLGLLGFLGGFNDIPANLGLFDIISALEWIQKHIEAFGGDNKNITLYGQSAGGDAIANLMLIETADQWFQKAIIQSAPLGIGRGRKEMTNTMIEAAKSLSKTASIEEILDIQEQITSQLSGFGLKAAMPFGIQYGHAPLPKEDQIDEIWRKNASKFQVMLGTTAEETSLYVPKFEKFHKYFSIPLIGNFLKKLFIQYTTNKVYRTAAKKWAKNFKKGKSQIFLYDIVWGSKANGFGATHSIDMPLLFADKAIWKNAKILEGLDWGEIKAARKAYRQTLGGFMHGENASLNERIIKTRK